VVGFERVLLQNLASALRLQHLAGSELGSPQRNVFAREWSMSIASSQRSRRAAARLAKRPAAAPTSAYESPEDRDWDGRVAREVKHQEVIEATLDRAEAYARLGDFKRAVEWLDRAATVGGDLSATDRAHRARWARGVVHR